MTQRLDPDERRAVIVSALVTLAREHGVMQLDHMSVANYCEIETSDATVRRYFHTIGDLRRAAIEASDHVAEEARRLGLIGPG